MSAPIFTAEAQWRGEELVHLGEAGCDLVAILVWSVITENDLKALALLKDCWPWVCWEWEIENARKRASTEPKLLPEFSSASPRLRGEREVA